MENFDMVSHEEYMLERAQDRIKSLQDRVKVLEKAICIFSREKLDIVFSSDRDAVNHFIELGREGKGWERLK